MNRKIIYIFSCILFAFASCTNMQTELSKKWKLTTSVNQMRDTLFAQMSREIKLLKGSIAKLTDSTQLIVMNEQLSQSEFAMNLFNRNVKKLMEESFLDLKSNGEYNTNIIGNEKGKWELSANKKFIYFHTAEKNISDTLIIKEFKAGGNLILAFDSATYLVFQYE